jgi:monoamine oxidase
MKKVIIIGAGAAGLMAARELLKTKHDVIIIEARSRIGGRIHTIIDSDFSVSIEQGAEFVHGKLPLTLELMNEAKIRIDEMAGEVYQVHNGKEHEGEFFNDDWDLMMTELKKLKTDLTFNDFLKEKFPYEKYKDLNENLRGFVEGYNAANVDKASAIALRDEWLSEDHAVQLRPKGGYSQMMDYLYKQIQASGGVLHLSSIVTRVKWSRDHVEVIDSDGKSFSANQVLITVPIGVLQSDAIKFDPTIPAYHKAACNVGFGGVIKITIEFRKAFWETQTGKKMPSLRFLFSDAEIPTWWSQLPEHTPILTGWLGGPKAENLHKTEKEIYEMAVSSLSYAFNCSKDLIIDHIKAWHVSDWTKDPYSLGAYAYATLQTQNAREILTTSLEDTIFFAGEALYDGPEIGTVEAALVSGSSIAKKIQSGKLNVMNSCLKE